MGRVSYLRRRLTDDRLIVPQLVMLSVYFAGGVAMLWDGVPSVIRDAMGGQMHTVWTWLLIFGPALTVLGVLARNQWSGAWLRVSGAIAVGMALLTYTLSTAQVYGLATFATAMSAGLTVCTGFLFASDCILLRRIDRLARDGD